MRKNVTKCHMSNGELNPFNKNITHFFFFLIFFLSKDIRKNPFLTHANIFNELINK